MTDFREGLSEYEQVSFDDLTAEGYSPESARAYIDSDEDSNTAWDNLLKANPDVKASSSYDENGIPYGGDNPREPEPEELDLDKIYPAMSKNEDPSLEGLSREYPSMKDLPADKVELGDRPVE